MNCGKKQLKCTVIVPTYNRKLLLQRTLSALSCQTVPSETFEVIVVDDGSSDGSEDAISSFRDGLDLRYFWQPDEGFRPAAARNIGLQHARGEVIVFLDSGVVPHSLYLDRLLEIHHAKPSTAVVGYVYCFDGRLQDAADLDAALQDAVDIDRFCEECSARVDTFDAREPIYRLCQDELGQLDAPWVVFWTCSVSARADDLRLVGGFDENFRSWGGEDIELGYRLLRSGVNLQLARSAMAVHYPHPSDIKQNRRTALLNFRYFAKKHKITVSDALMGSVWTSLYGR